MTKEVPSGEETSSSGEATATATAAEGGSGAALAEGEGSSDGARFRFSLIELKRSGPTVVANATVTWVEGGDDNMQVAGTFGDGVDATLEGDAPEPHDTFDGIALIDPEGRKKYLVARDSRGLCVCTSDLNSTFVEDGTPVTLEATLSAPPGEVTEVNVFVPRVKTFTGVPIEG